jgi:hypothetical protein
MTGEELERKVARLEGRLERMENVAAELRRLIRTALARHDNAMRVHEHMLMDNFEDD